jgi:hypothetical protein
MHRVEIWIDVVCREEGRSDTLCTLFSNIEIPVRPCVGETLSFHPMARDAVEFELATSTGVSRQSSVMVVVDDVRHNIVSGSDGIQFSTTLRCTEISVASEGDAREVVAFMATQMGFELDPYGTNKLGI